MIRQPVFGEWLPVKKGNFITHVDAGRTFKGRFYKFETAFHCGRTHQHNYSFQERLLEEYLFVLIKILCLTANFGRRPVKMNW